MYLFVLDKSLEEIEFPEEQLELILLFEVFTYEVSVLFINAGIDYLHYKKEDYIQELITEILTNEKINKYSNSQDQKNLIYLDINEINKLKEKANLVWYG